MIARVWKGITLESDSESYLKYLEENKVKNYRNIPGNKGVYLLQRNDDENTEFLIISLWDSLDSIQKFACSGIEKAVYTREDKKYLLKLEPDILHYNITFENIPKNISSEDYWKIPRGII
ncbi:antibiotic biosynthesis monooxygenase [Stygiobacter electus]|uniref:ABM domain-containing protein n=1 Tax=Stygiobacter electus TaxID=3032292 RepID=A0AAE3P436_9BACT|nr:antibiotic biosynthesis monooxygenase [Stygiobacter electus]MDF1612848.1 hypothetical protein [Stygiobacter electus]